MKTKTIGFIGGGRITKIILKALENFGQMPEQVIVSDTSSEILEKLKTEFPNIITTQNNNEPAGQDMLLISLHPPVMAEVLADIKNSIKDDCIIISLAPKFSISKISALIDGRGKILRMIPNAATIINNGYNPIAFSEKFGFAEKAELVDFLSAFGEAPEVEEEKLEAYAILCAMGPTYFWFQLNELKRLAVGFGLSEEETETGIQKMMAGGLDTLFNSGLSYEDVVNLVPVKPLADAESMIKNIYAEKLTAINEKIKAI